jgi:hypothetical protein
MCATTCFDWLEELTCLIATWKSNIHDSGGRIQRSTIDNSYVSMLLLKKKTRQLFYYIIMYGAILIIRA